MPFYSRHPLDTLLLSDPFFTNFFWPGAHNRPREGITQRGEKGEEDVGGVRAFSPNFDVHETHKEYILEGELPGLDKNNLTIEFTDTNTLVIRGKIERSYTAEVPADKLLEGVGLRGTITEGKEEKEEGKEKEKEKEGEKKEGEKREGKGEDEPVKYWISERTVGTFQRSFSFPGEIDQDNVKASYENGLLRIVVPKKEKRSAKRIDIQ